ncbi:hypothetical protein TELCIR_03988 [Teladorsagia circumcincta]|uniref:Reverse transcriptase domain-containing protein n=1 Tax=Teladorsagia circumcincta TaxID=45464 RepID=A0A2G9UUT2_TELCI|nr:hypothetical protein TELCIR_03988 [Teladorsagia circumcincta]
MAEFSAIIPEQMKCLVRICGLAADIHTHYALRKLQSDPETMLREKAAPAIQEMDALSTGLSGTAAYFDNIAVTGKTVDEHNVRLVFRKTQDLFRLESGSLLLTEIRYLGFRTNAHGRRPDPTKPEAVHKMPISKDVTQLKAFLGLVAFYEAFIRYSSCKI